MSASFDLVNLDISASLIGCLVAAGGDASIVCSPSAVAHILGAGAGGSAPA
jgi:hypothetical protein